MVVENAFISPSPCDVDVRECSLVPQHLLEAGPIRYAGGEPESEFELRCLLSVTAVNDVVADVHRVVAADGAWRRFAAIGGADDVACD